MSYYLLEIACEELPAHAVALAADYVQKESEKQLAAWQLAYTELKADATPRRIYVYIDGFNDKQDDRQELVMGPPAKIAFNEDGSVSEAGIKFAKSKGLSIETLTKSSTEKGEYLSGIKKIDGQLSTALMKTLGEHLVKSIPFPKTMRWGAFEVRFSRPLTYILSIYNGNLLPLDVEGVETVNTTAGHRFMAPAKVEVKDFDSYLSALKNGKVIATRAERKVLIEKQVAELNKKADEVTDLDAELLDTVTNIVEYPHAIEGSFNEKFLELPEPVLITSMKNHQKYFPVYDKNKNLLAKFIGISNMQPDDDSLIRGGYERVLSARLNDAMFFYNNDKNVPLIDRLEMLKKVVYQEKLGTSYEKLERMRSLALKLADLVAPARKEEVERTATLCKADLMCEMVYEFPELQGYMGNIYAGLQGETPEVALAIEEHYKPRFSGDSLPSSDVGKIVSVADKMDTIAGAFAVGLMPTGNVDPYGLRRAAIGILNIIESSGWHISLKTLIKESIALVKSKATEDINATEDKVAEFFKGRHKQLTVSANVDSDAYDAAAAIIFDDIIVQTSRAKALTEAKNTESFKSIAQSYKRINNILKKASFNGTSVNEALFETDEENTLYKLYINKVDDIKILSDEENPTVAILELNSFAESLSAFFDKVMVMAKDDAVRTNRLSLLNSLKSLFDTVGDLSLLQV